MGPNYIKYDTPLVEGMAIVAGWPSTTLLPLQGTLNAVAARFGTPFQVSYLDMQHVGITMEKRVEAYEVYKAFYDATGGNAPYIILLPTDAEWQVSLETKKAEFLSAVDDSIAAIQNGAIYGARLPSTGSRWTEYLLYGLAGLGVLYVGYRIFGFAESRRKR